MADDSRNQKWYLADVVELGEDPDKTTTNPNRRCLTWVNTLLIESTSLDKAYDKALAIANSRYPQSYKAAAGNIFKWTVLGLSSVREIEEELKDGAEITWVDRGHISFNHAESLVKTKEQLLNDRATERSILN